MKRLFLHYLQSHSRLAQFLRFATVGVKISLIDAGLLYMLTHTPYFTWYTARIISLGTAIMVGYVLNRYFTFGGNQRGCFYRQMAGHFGVHFTGGLINYGVFTAVVYIAHETIDNKLFEKTIPLVALIIGGVIGMMFNFFWSNKLVFRHKQKAVDTSS